MMSRSRYTLLSGAGLALALGGVLGAQQAAPGGVRPTAGAPNSATTTTAGRPAAYNAAYAVAIADSAIDQLEDFLERYPNSPLRPNALFQLGELLVRRADEEFAQAQRAAGGSAATGDTIARGGDVPIRANYAPAIARYEELVRRYPNFQKIDAAAYTLGTLYVQNQRWDDAVRMFEMVVAADSSQFGPEAQFRLGDARFELAARQRGDPRRAQFARAAEAYRGAVSTAQQGGDIYFLSLYKLGWAYYNQATQTNRAPYDSAVAVFAQLVDAYDKLSQEQQARLGLRGEAIEYMAVAFTQVGGAAAADRFFAGRNVDYRMPIIRRVAQSLRDQGSFPEAIEAYENIITQAPTDSGALAAQREIIDIRQNRMIDNPGAQAARLQLVERFGPQSEWARANPGLAAEAGRAREEALRQAGQFELAAAQRGNRAGFQQAASLYERYLNEFQNTDSAQVVATYYAAALFGQGRYMEAGAAYSRAAYGFGERSASSTPADTAAAPRDSARRDTTRAVSPAELQRQAAQNAIVAFDSAVVRNKADRAAQDSLFAAVDRFVQRYPQTDVAKKALIAKGRRASEAQRWDVMAQTFRSYAQTYPNDPYTPTAQKLVGDALYRGGQYAEAQTQWEAATEVARASGRRALVDSLTRTRESAAGMFADTLIRRGEYRRAAEEVYVAYADRNPQNPKAPDALRDAIETYMIVVDSARQKNLSDDQVQQARNRAIELSQRLVKDYPTYRYASQYRTLNARLLAEAGRREEAVGALRSIAAEAPKGVAQADAMIRLAVTLDSSGNKRDAAAAYEQFAKAYPADRRASDARFNAAVTYIEAGDTASAARVYGEFAAAYPRSARADTARARQIVLLRASGDSATAETAFARLCASNPSDAGIRSECTARTRSRAAQGSFDRGVSLFQTYQAERLVIRTRSQLTRAGVERASARKRSQLTQLTAQFTSAIRSGVPEYVAAGTYYVGLAQQEYGNFLRDVELPADLSDEEKEAGRRGAEQQAQQYYEAARSTWQALLEKAEQDEALRNDQRAAQWIQRTRDAVQNAPAAPAQQQNPPADSPAANDRGK